MFQAKSVKKPVISRGLRLLDIFNFESLLYDFRVCKEEHVEPIDDVILEDGQIVRTFTPQTTVSKYQVYTTIVLQPGQKINIKALHGVNGSFDARGITETGRRKKLSDQIGITFPDV